MILENYYLGLVCFNTPEHTLEIQRLCLYRGGNPDEAIDHFNRKDTQRIYCEVCGAVLRAIAARPVAHPDADFNNRQ